MFVRRALNDSAIIDFVAVTAIFFAFSLCPINPSIGIFVVLFISDGL